MADHTGHFHFSLYIFLSNFPVYVTSKFCLKKKKQTKQALCHKLLLHRSRDQEDEAPDPPQWGSYSHTLGEDQGRCLHTVQLFESEEINLKLRKKVLPHSRKWPYEAVVSRWHRTEFKCFPGGLKVSGWEVSCDCFKAQIYSSINAMNGYVMPQCQKTGHTWKTFNRSSQAVRGWLAPIRPG